MTKDGFRIIVFLIALSLLPLRAGAVIEEKSSIIGSILGAANTPISGITVRLLDSFFLSEVARTTTDQAGKFQLANLLPGLYLITVESPSLAASFKRVEVLSGKPTIIDLRSVLDEKELKKHDAWDQFKWTIRVAERNPLRETEPVQIADDDHVASYASDHFFANLRNWKESNNIRGNVSYLSANPTNSNWARQLASFAMEGGASPDAAWSVNGNFMDGARSSYVAYGNFHYRLGGHQLTTSFSANDLLYARFPEERPIKKWISSPDTGGIGDQNKMWVTSMDLQDQWTLHQLQISYGSRIDYYGYLEEPVNYSPHLNLTYRFTPVFSVHTLYYRDQSAPGNYYLQAETLRPYIHELAFVPYNQGVHCEKTEGYETGADFHKDDYALSVFYHTEQVANKIATIDLQNSFLSDLLRSNRPFVIFNAKEMDSKGIGARLSKQISPGITAVASYTISQALPIYIIEKRGANGRQLFFMDGVSQQQYHDVEAGVQAHIRQSRTDVQADWKWSSGTPLIFGTRRDINPAMSAVDLEVHQAIPVHFLSQSEIKLLIAVKNVLDQNHDSATNADFERALLYTLPRTVAGGVLWQF